MKKWLRNNALDKLWNRQCLHLVFSHIPLIALSHAVLPPLVSSSSLVQNQTCPLVFTVNDTLTSLIPKISLGVRKATQLSLTWVYWHKRRKDFLMWIACNINGKCWRLHWRSGIIQHLCSWSPGSLSYRLSGTSHQFVNKDNFSSTHFGLP